MATADLIIKNKFSTEEHPWSFHVPDGATRLLIGTFPTERRNRKHDFFYCSATNRFWEVMAGIADISLIETETTIAISNRKKVLQSLHLALTDMGKIVYRQQGSSNDHSLFPVEFMNITEILSNSPLIDTIILSGSKQGNSSLQWFSIFCDLNNISFYPKKLDKVNNVTVSIGNKLITVVKGLSTSRQSRITTEELVNHYTNIFKK